jgi:hypothetical protein
MERRRLPCKIKKSLYGRSTMLLQTRTAAAWLNLVYLVSGVTGQAQVAVISNVELPTKWSKLEEGEVGNPTRR